MKDQRHVSIAEGQSLGTYNPYTLAAQYKIPYIETSAKTGDEVQRAFTQLSSSIIKRVGVQQRNRVGMKLGSEQPKQEPKKNDPCCP